MLLLIILLVLLFGGGGGYYGYSQWGPVGGGGFVFTIPDYPRWHENQAGEAPAPDSRRR